MSKPKAPPKHSKTNPKPPEKVAKDAKRSNKPSPPKSTATNGKKPMSY